MLSDLRAKISPTSSPLACLVWYLLSYIGLMGLLWLAAHRTSVAPSATPQARPTIHWRYATKTSPTGRFQLQEKCPPKNISGLCSWIFPNGNETPPFALDMSLETSTASLARWSSDDQFIFICAELGSSIECVNPTPQIWDVANGSLVAHIGAGIPAAQWKPNESILAYYDMEGRGPNVYLLDVKSGKESTMTTCPRWLVDPLPKDVTPGMLVNSQAIWLDICNRLSHQATLSVP